MRTNSSAACAARNLVRRFIGRSVIKRRPVALIAAALEEFAMPMDDVARACLFVQIVHVLCASKKPIANHGLKPRNCKMRRVWFGCCGYTTPHGIELPNELRITLPGVRRCNLLDAVIAP